MIIHRRRFLVTASGAVTAAAAAAVVDAPNVIAQPKIQWRLSTTWPTSLDVMQGSAQRLAKLVEEATGGRFRIETFADGQIMPAFDCFPATSQGTIEAFMAAPSYWAAKEPAIEWFQTVPFGMNPEGMMAWYYEGDGLKMWEETYAPFNLVPRQGPAFSPQMAGWFRKKINTIGDYKGLKMRIGAGLGNKVIGKAGGAPVLIPASGIFAALERGVIDAAEWVGPYDDEKLGFHKIARHYYYPGWWEGGPQLSFYVNQTSWKALPEVYRQAFEVATSEANQLMLAQYDAKNPPALLRLVGQGVKLHPYPKDVMLAARRATFKLYEEEAQTNADFATIYRPWKAFRDTEFQWFKVAEAAYSNFNYYVK